MSYSYTLFFFCDQGYLDFLSSSLIKLNSNIGYRCERGLILSVPLFYDRLNTYFFTNMILT